MPEGLVKHTARLFWIDQNREVQSERHVAWSANRATCMAWKRARSMMLHGEAKAFRIEHTERVFTEGSVRPTSDPFAIPEITAREPSRALSGQ